MLIRSSDLTGAKKLLKNLYIPPPISHKGQNGRVLVIGGSSLFHASSIWAAEVASHIVDMVHYSSTQENNEIILSLKKKFLNGMVVKKEQIPSYAEEDDVILIGPGMVRGETGIDYDDNVSKKLAFEEILNIEDEATYSYALTRYLLTNFPNKRFVIDAGALQVMKKEWLSLLKFPAIITPHQIEFKTLFGIDVFSESIDEKIKIVSKQAKKNKCVILLKSVSDIISDGDKTFQVEGGNAGLTKGGTGDILAGLTSSFYAKNDACFSAAASSVILKRTAERLFNLKGYWYNIDDVMEAVPFTIRELVLK